MTASRPPGLADWLLRHLASGPRLESILGDLQEQLGGGRSVAWYWRQTITTILVGPMKQRLLWVLISTVVAAAITATLSHYFLPTRYQAEAMLQLMPARVPETYVPPTRTVPTWWPFECLQSCGYWASQRNRRLPIVGSAAHGRHVTARSHDKVLP